uniref:Uncharacterized protein n=1 Tax=Parascaris equorum TaxID=6256 RepID=A0A914SA15_PAREQ
MCRPSVFVFDSLCFSNFISGDLSISGDLKRSFSDCVTEPARQMSLR